MRDISFLQTSEKVVDLFLKGTVHAFNIKSWVAFTTRRTFTLKLMPFLYSMWHDEFRKVGSHGCKCAWRTSGIVTWQLERYDFFLVNFELMLHLWWARYFSDRSERGRRKRLGVMLRKVSSVEQRASHRIGRLAGEFSQRNISTRVCRHDIDHLSWSRLGKVQRGVTVNLKGNLAGRLTQTGTQFFHCRRIGDGNLTTSHRQCRRRRRVIGWARRLLREWSFKSSFGAWGKFSRPSTFVLVVCFSFWRVPAEAAGFCNEKAACTRLVRSRTEQRLNRARFLTADHNVSYLLNLSMPITDSEAFYLRLVQGYMQKCTP